MDLRKRIWNYAVSGTQFVPVGFSIVNYLRDKELYEKIKDPEYSSWKVDTCIINFLIETGRLAGAVGLEETFNRKVGIASYLLFTGVVMFMSADRRKDLLKRHSRLENTLTETTQETRAHIR